MNDYELCNEDQKNLIQKFSASDLTDPSSFPLLNMPISRTSTSSLYYKTIATKNDKTHFQSTQAINADAGKSVQTFIEKHGEANSHFWHKVTDQIPFIGSVVGGKNYDLRTALKQNAVSVSQAATGTRTALMFKLDKEYKGMMKTGQTKLSHTELSKLTKQFDELNQIIINSLRDEKPVISTNDLMVITDNNIDNAKNLFEQLIINKIISETGEIINIDGINNLDLSNSALSEIKIADIKNIYDETIENQRQLINSYTSWNHLVTEKIKDITVAAIAGESISTLRSKATDLAEIFYGNPDILQGNGDGIDPPNTRSLALTEDRAIPNKRIKQLAFASIIGAWVQMAMLALSATNSIRGYNELSKVSYMALFLSIFNYNIHSSNYMIKSMKDEASSPDTSPLMKEYSIPESLKDIVSGSANFVKIRYSNSTLFGNEAVHQSIRARMFNPGYREIINNDTQGDTYSLVYGQTLNLQKKEAKIHYILETHLTNENGTFKYGLSEDAAKRLAYALGIEHREYSTYATLMETLSRTGLVTRQSISFSRRIGLKGGEYSCAFALEKIIRQTAGGDKKCLDFISKLGRYFNQLDMKNMLDIKTRTEILSFYFNTHKIDANTQNNILQEIDKGFEQALREELFIAANKSGISFTTQLKWKMIPDKVRKILSTLTNNLVKPDFNSKVMHEAAKKGGIGINTLKTCWMIDTLIDEIKYENSTTSVARLSKKFINKMNFKDETEKQDKNLPKEQDGLTKEQDAQNLKNELINYYKLSEEEANDLFGQLINDKGIEDKALLISKQYAPMARDQGLLLKMQEAAELTLFSERTEFRNHQEGNLKEMVRVLLHKYKDQPEKLRAHRLYKTVNRYFNYNIPEKTFLEQTETSAQLSGGIEFSNTQLLPKSNFKYNNKTGKLVVTGGIKENQKNRLLEIFTSDNDKLEINELMQRAKTYISEGDSLTILKKIRENKIIEKEDIFQEDYQLDLNKLELSNFIAYHDEILAKLRTHTQPGLEVLYAFANSLSYEQTQSKENQSHFGDKKQKQVANFDKQGIGEKGATDSSVREHIRICIENDLFELNNTEYISNEDQYRISQTLAEIISVEVAEIQLDYFDNRPANIIKWMNTNLTFEEAMNRHELEMFEAINKRIEKMLTLNNTDKIPATKKAPSLINREEFSLLVEGKSGKAKINKAIKNIKTDVIDNIPLIDKLPNSEIHISKILETSHTNISNSERETIIKCLVDKKIIDKNEKIIGSLNDLNRNDLPAVVINNFVAISEGLNQIKELIDFLIVSNRTGMYRFQVEDSKLMILGAITRDEADKLIEIYPESELQINNIFTKRQNTFVFDEIIKQISTKLDGYNSNKIILKKIKKQLVVEERVQEDLLYELYILASGLPGNIPEEYEGNTEIVDFVVFCTTLVNSINTQSTENRSSVMETLAAYIKKGNSNNTSIDNPIIGIIQNASTEHIRSFYTEANELRRGRYTTIHNRTEDSITFFKKLAEARETKTKNTNTVKRIDKLGEKNFSNKEALAALQEIMGNNFTSFINKLINRGKGGDVYGEPMIFSEIEENAIRMIFDGQNEFQFKSTNHLTKNYARKGNEQVLTLDLEDPVMKILNNCRMDVAFMKIKAQQASEVLTTYNPKQNKDKQKKDLTKKLYEALLPRLSKEAKKAIKEMTTDETISYMIQSQTNNELLMKLALNPDDDGHKQNMIFILEYTQIFNLIENLYGNDPNKTELAKNTLEKNKIGIDTLNEQINQQFDLTKQQSDIREELFNTIPTIIFDENEMEKAEQMTINFRERLIDTYLSIRPLDLNELPKVNGYTPHAIRDELVKNGYLSHPGWIAPGYESGQKLNLPNYLQGVKSDIGKVLESLFIHSQDRQFKSSKDYIKQQTAKGIGNTGKNNSEGMMYALQDVVRHVFDSQDERKNNLREILAKKGNHIQELRDLFTSTFVFDRAGALIGWRRSKAGNTNNVLMGVTHSERLANKASMIMDLKSLECYEMSRRFPPRLLSELEDNLSKMIIFSDDPEVNSKIQYELGIMPQQITAYMLQQIKQGHLKSDNLDTLVDTLIKSWNLSDKQIKKHSKISLSTIKSILKEHLDGTATAYYAGLAVQKFGFDKFVTAIETFKNNPSSEEASNGLKAIVSASLFQSLKENRKLCKDFHTSLIKPDTKIPPEIMAILSNREISLINRLRAETPATTLPSSVESKVQQIIKQSDYLFDQDYLQDEWWTWASQFQDWTGETANNMIAKSFAGATADSLIKNTQRLAGTYTPLTELIVDDARSYQELMMMISSMGTYPETVTDKGHVLPFRSELRKMAKILDLMNDLNIEPNEDNLFTFLKMITDSNTKDTEILAKFNIQDSQGKLKSFRSNSQNYLEHNYADKRLFIRPASRRIGATFIGNFDADNYSFINYALYAGQIGARLQFRNTKPVFNKLTTIKNTLNNHPDIQTKIDNIINSIKNDASQISFNKERFELILKDIDSLIALMNKNPDSKKLVDSIKETLQQQLYFSPLRWYCSIVQFGQNFEGIENNLIRAQQMTDETNSKFMKQKTIAGCYNYSHLISITQQGRFENLPIVRNLSDNIYTSYFAPMINKIFNNDNAADKLWNETGYGVFDVRSLLFNDVRSEKYKEEGSVRVLAKGKPLTNAYYHALGNMILMPYRLADMYRQNTGGHMFYKALHGLKVLTMFSVGAMIVGNLNATGVSVTAMAALSAILAKELGSLYSAGVIASLTKILKNNPGLAFTLGSLLFSVGLSGSFMMGGGLEYLLSSMHPYGLPFVTGLAGLTGMLLPQKFLFPQSSWMKKLLPASDKNGTTTTPAPVDTTNLSFEQDIKSLDSRISSLANKSTYNHLNSLRDRGFHLFDLEFFREEQIYTEASIVEDFSTSLYFKLRGFKSDYMENTVGVNAANWWLFPFMTQRTRWWGGMGEQEKFITDMYGKNSRRLSTKEWLHMYCGASGPLTAGTRRVLLANKSAFLSSWAASMAFAPATALLVTPLLFSTTKLAGLHLLAGLFVSHLTYAMTLGTIRYSKISKGSTFDETSELFNVLEGPGSTIMYPQSIVRKYNQRTGFVQTVDSPRPMMVDAKHPTINAARMVANIQLAEIMGISMFSLIGAALGNPALLYLLPVAFWSYVKKLQISAGIGLNSGVTEYFKNYNQTSDKVRDMTSKRHERYWLDQVYKNEKIMENHDPAQGFRGYNRFLSAFRIE